jgi:hypothetical protein
VPGQGRFYYVVYAPDDTVTAISIFEEFAGAEEIGERWPGLTRALRRCLGGTHLGNDVIGCRPRPDGGARRSDIMINPVLIVGPTSLTAALELSRMGVAVRLLFGGKLKHV